MMSVDSHWTQLSTFTTNSGSRGLSGPLTRQPPSPAFYSDKKQKTKILSNTIWFKHVSHPSSQGQAGRLVLALAIAVPLARHGASLGLAAHLALRAHARHLRGAWPHGARAGHLLAHLRAHGDLGPRVGAVALLAWLGTLRQRKETVTKGATTSTFTLEHGPSAHQG